MQQALTFACNSLPPAPRPSVVLCPGSSSRSPGGQGASVGAAVSKLCDLGKHRALSPLCEMEITSQNPEGKMKQFTKTQNMHNCPAGSGCCYCLDSRLGIPSFGKPVVSQGVVILCYSGCSRHTVALPRTGPHLSFLHLQILAQAHE